ncbi:VanZ like family protein [Ruaniaceae bacterium KH17]|nr:VanZ like family protein [Ruaniaceae bacterium KH17]
MGERRREAEVETTRTLHRIGAIGAVAVLIVILAITLSPTPVDEGRAHWVVETLRVLHRLGVPGSFGYRELEFTANIVMFIPLGVFLAMLLDRSLLWLGVLAFPGLSIVIELFQLFVLPQRSATLSDVIANAIGGILGFTVTWLVLHTGHSSSPSSA